MVWSVRTSFCLTQSVRGAFSGDFNVRDETGAISLYRRRAGRAVITGKYFNRDLSPLYRGIDCMESTLAKVDCPSHLSNFLSLDSEVGMRPTYTLLRPTMDGSRIEGRR